MDLADILSRTTLFDHVESPETLFESADWEIKSYRAGETVASTMDDCLHLGILLSGSAEIQNIYPSGKIASLKKLGPWDFFGEAILPKQIHSFPSDIEALEETEILMIRKTALLKAIKQSDPLLENYIGLISGKLLMMNNKIKMLSLETLRKKICWFLLDAHRKQGVLELSIPYTQEELANALGSQRPSVSREINRMQKEGLIAYSRGRIEIKNLSKLHALLR